MGWGRNNGLDAMARVLLPVVAASADIRLGNADIDVNAFLAPGGHHGHGDWRYGSNRPPVYNRGYNQYADPLSSVNYPTVAREARENHMSVSQYIRAMQSGELDGRGSEYADNGRYRDTGLSPEDLGRTNTPNPPPQDGDTVSIAYLKGMTPADRLAALKNDKIIINGDDGKPISPELRAAEISQGQLSVTPPPGQNTGTGTTNTDTNTPAPAFQRDTSVFAVTDGSAASLVIDDEFLKNSHDGKNAVALLDSGSVTHNGKPVSDVERTLAAFAVWHKALSYTPDPDPKKQGAAYNQALGFKDATEAGRAFENISAVYAQADPAGQQKILDAYQTFLADTKNVDTAAAAQVQAQMDALKAIKPGVAPPGQSMGGDFWAMIEKFIKWIESAFSGNTNGQTQTQPGQQPPGQQPPGQQPPGQQPPGQQPPGQQPPGQPQPKPAAATTPMPLTPEQLKQFAIKEAKVDGFNPTAPGQISVTDPKDKTRRDTLLNELAMMGFAVDRNDFTSEVNSKAIAKVESALGMKPNQPSGYFIINSGLDKVLADQNVRADLLNAGVGNLQNAQQADPAIAQAVGAARQRAAAGAAPGPK